MRRCLSIKGDRAFIEPKYLGFLGWITTESHSYKGVPDLVQYALHFVLKTYNNFVGNKIVGMIYLQRKCWQQLCCKNLEVRQCHLV
jgi:hypothetical protein